MNRLYRMEAIAAGALLALALTAASAAAVTYYVDNQNPQATDSGPGTEATPYRTITAAVTQRGGAGNTIVVKTGLYPEQVTVGASGLSGSPFVIQAQGVVTLDGSDDFSSTSLWTLLGGDVWRASSVSWTPLQVFADGQRLAASTASPALLPARTFRHVVGEGLYVNAGGGNPGTHGTRVGRRPYGFRLAGRSFVTIRGFTLARHEEKGIYALTGSQNVVIENNVVTFARTQGIAVNGSVNPTIAGNESAFNGDHGIYLSTGVTGGVVRGNRSHHNDRVVDRGANGIHLFGSANNRIEANRCHDNDDSGFQNNAESHDNLYVQNLSYANADHGYDHLGSNNVVHIGNVAYGNFNDGFSFEGTSPGGKVHDCIGVNNGIGTNHYDLWVDATSIAGFVSDYNVFWNSTAQPPVRSGASIYSTVAAWAAASGNDTHSDQADPRFVNAAGGDFHLLAGSPAIDAATSAVSGWPALDFEGRARIDVAGVPNRGAGSVPWADRGAFEFVPEATPNLPPVAALSVSPSSGTAPLTVTANASASSDPDGSIVSYRFDFGDGVIVGPQASASANHTYAAGNWTVTVRVADDDGATDTESRSVSVSTAADRPPVVVAPASASGNEGATITVNVTASDPDGNSIASLTADLSGLPPGHDAVFTPAVDNRSGTLTWRPSYSHSGTYPVTFRAANALAGTRITQITVNHVDWPPAITIPSELRVRPGTALSIPVTVIDPDHDPITSLSASFSGLPSGHNANFIRNETNTLGTFEWTPTAQGNYDIRFTAISSQTVTATMRVQVRRNGSVTGVDDEIPAALALSPARPNPSRGDVRFELELPRATVVTWSVHDVGGRELWRESAHSEAGRRTIEWGGAAAAGELARGGLYWIRVEAEGQRLARRFVRL